MQDWMIAAAIGAALGALAYNGAPGKIRGGPWLSMLIGALAAACTIWIGIQVHLQYPFQMAGLLMAVVGTALILAIWRTVMGPAGPA